MPIEAATPAVEERPSLTDTLSAAFDAAKVDAPVANTAPALDLKPVATTPVGEAPKAEVKGVDPKVDATGRTHAADGKFTPKEGEKAQEAAPVQRPKRPDSWKKEYWGHWDQIDPQLASYLAEREHQYLNGVTTYKNEWERARPVLEALQPYQQLMQSSNVSAPQFIKALADTHQTLTTGDQNAKLRAFARFAKDYKIPLEQLLIQGDDGKVYLNQTYFADQQPAATQQQLSSQEIDKLVDAKFAQRELQRMVQSFTAEKGADGKSLHPHFETVKGTMDGLLRTGLAKDLESAYQAALAMPQHAELATAERQQREQQAIEDKKRQEQEEAQRARASIVSPRSQAPTALVQDTRGKKGLRDQLSAAFDASGTGGRV